MVNFRLFIVIFNLTFFSMHSMEQLQNDLYLLKTTLAELSNQLDKLSQPQILDFNTAYNKAQDSLKKAFEQKKEFKQTIEKFVSFPWDQPIRNNEDQLYKILHTLRKTFQQNIFYIVVQVLEPFNFLFAMKNITLENKKNCLQVIGTLKKEVQDLITFLNTKNKQYVQKIQSKLKAYVPTKEKDPTGEGIDEDITTNMAQLLTQLQTLVEALNIIEYTITSGKLDKLNTIFRQANDEYPNIQKLTTNYLDDINNLVLQDIEKDDLKQISIKLRNLYDTQQKLEENITAFRKTFVKATICIHFSPNVQLINEFIEFLKKFKEHLEIHQLRIGTYLNRFDEKIKNPSLEKKLNTIYYANITFKDYIEEVLKEINKKINTNKKSVENTLEAFTKGQKQFEQK